MILYIIPMIWFVFAPERVYRATFLLRFCRDVDTRLDRFYTTIIGTVFHAIERGIQPCPKPTVRTQTVFGTILVPAPCAKKPPARAAGRNSTRGGAMSMLTLDRPQHFVHYILTRYHHLAM